MGEVRTLITHAIEEGMHPFGMVEVGGEVFGQLLEELALETHTMHTTMSKELVIHTTLPDGTVVYLNTALHPGMVMISNVQGIA